MTEVMDDRPADKTCRSTRKMGMADDDQGHAAVGRSAMRAVAGSIPAAPTAGADRWSPDGRRKAPRAPKTGPGGAFLLS
jgi:hypothetical protein